MAVYLENLGYKFDEFFGQEKCEEGEYPGMKTKKHVKNLEVISKEFKIPIENCILVDDSTQKSVKGQNFLKIKEIDLFKEDEELIRIGLEIDKFIKCKKECEIKKYKRGG
ncbi:hypothetical protein NBO_30g0004 [Nosema bombycis CQ1]|uniref:Uncharacterized protein n=1 Tax=Nosema bombycis (strain CQ1 / CVCC 102059) TaxID=578461 RepID=R0MJC0_NOSB1|nr:hypothetical protein NBO_30g0004 [Nosema bombycis CQ1]|eukprot:EOB14310.1 hypothetical protein NBO_30g0004 [Nosema bombycis CQ1]